MTMPQDIKAHNRELIAQFRAEGGAPGGKNLLLLTTTGARTGREHTTPMMFIPDGDRILVVASNAGAPAHPDWYRNLVAHSDVTVEVTGDTYQARAEPLRGEERDRVFAWIVEQYPFFGDHQAKVARRIPVVDLVRA
jgi:deazaflavin-dependent oxidoreductase (nitroreductase family)